MNMAHQPSPGPVWASLKEPAPSSSSVAPSEDELDTDQMNEDDVADPPRKRKATHLSSPGAKRPRVGSNSNAKEHGNGSRGKTSADEHGPEAHQRTQKLGSSSHHPAIAGSSKPHSVARRRLSSPSISFGLSRNVKKNGISPPLLDLRSSSAATKPVRRTRREKERQRSSESPPPMDNAFNAQQTAPQARSQMLSMASQVTKRVKKPSEPTKGKHRSSPLSSSGQGKIGISLKSSSGQNRPSSTSKSRQTVASRSHTDPEIIEISDSDDDIPPKASIPPSRQKPVLLGTISLSSEDEPPKSASTSKATSSNANRPMVRKPRYTLPAMGSSKPLLQARAASIEVIDLCSSDDDLAVPAKPISERPTNPSVKSRPRSVTNPVLAPSPAVPSTVAAAPEPRPDALDVNDFPAVGQDVDSLLDFTEDHIDNEDRPRTPSASKQSVDLFADDLNLVVPASAPLPAAPPKSDMEPESSGAEQNVPEIESEQELVMNVEPEVDHGMESPQRDHSVKEPSQAAAGTPFCLDETRIASPEAMQIDETHPVEMSGQLSQEDPAVPPSVGQNIFVLRNDSSLFSSGNSSSSEPKETIVPTPEEPDHVAPAVSEVASASPTGPVNAVEASPVDVVMASPPSTNLTLELPPPPSPPRPPRKSYTDSFFQRIMERNRRSIQENHTNLGSQSQPPAPPSLNATPNKPVIPPPRRWSGSKPFASLSRSTSSSQVAFPSPSQPKSTPSGSTLADVINQAKLSSTKNIEPPATQSPIKQQSPPQQPLQTQPRPEPPRDIIDLSLDDDDDDEHAGLDEDTLASMIESTKVLSLFFPPQPSPKAPSSDGTTDAPIDREPSAISPPRIKIQQDVSPKDVLDSIGINDERFTPSRPSIMAIEDTSSQSPPKPSALSTIRSIRKIATAQHPFSPPVLTQPQPEGLGLPNISFSESTETFSPETVPLSGSRDISPTVLKLPGPIVVTQAASLPIAHNNDSSATVGISFLAEGVRYPPASAPSSATDNHSTTTGTPEKAPFSISFLRAPAQDSEVDHNAATSATLPLREVSAENAEQKLRGSDVGSDVGSHSFMEEGGSGDMEEEDEVIEYMDTQEDTQDDSANHMEPDLEGYDTNILQLRSATGTSSRSSLPRSSGLPSRPSSQSSLNDRAHFDDDELYEPLDELVISQTLNRSPTPDESLPPTTKNFNGIPVLTWRDFRRDLNNFKVEHLLAKDLPHNLQDYINAMDPYVREWQGMATILEIAIAENTADDEPDAPPIKVINNVDDEPTPPWEFHYTNKMYHGEGVPGPDISTLESCDCIGRCDPKSKTCACVRRQERYTKDYHEDFSYDNRGRVKTNGVPIFECNDLCGCGDECKNRVVQHGRKCIINLEKTKNKGWGVFAGPKKIPKGTFVGIYSGELLTEAVGGERGIKYNQFGRTYLFNIDYYYLDDQGKYVVDAYHAGNFTRFLNHSCEPNCAFNPCYINESNIDKPLLTVWTLCDIDPHEELTFSYHGPVDDDEEDTNSAPSSSPAKHRDDTIYAPCLCGTPSCKGKMFS